MNFDLDTPLIEFTDEPETAPWSIRNAAEGVAVFGGIGSGKTSGSGAFILKKYLIENFGGLILTAKKEERELVEEYCCQTGRSEDLIIVSPDAGNQNYFNFLEYLSSQGSEKTFTANLVQVLKTVLNARKEKDSGQSDDAFWRQSMEILLTNSIELCLQAYGKVTVSMLYDIVLSITQENKESAFNKAYSIFSQKIDDKIKAWTETIGKDHLDSLSDMAYNEALFKAIPAAREFKIMEQFFMDSYQQISSKTRSLIEFMFIGFMFPLLKDPLYSIFCDRPSTFTPEDCLKGKVVLIDIPVKIFNEVGRDIQILIKYIFQLSLEKRNIKENDRPVFIYADEAQHFIHEYDTEFQATARSSRICTVYLSQNISNYYISMGGEKSEHRVKAFLATLATKFFHANGDIEKTNKYASELIGEAWRVQETETITSSNGTTSTAMAVTVKLEKIVRPEEISGLCPGGPLNNLRVGAYIHVQGKKFASGFSHRLINFKQNYQPKPKN